MAGGHNKKAQGGSVDRKWEVDEATTVTAHFGGFGRKIVKVNGNEAYNARRMTSKGEIAFPMPGGRSGVVSVKPAFMGRRAPE